MPSSRTSEAATSSCVERGLEAHVTTVAPPALRARRRLAVSVVTWRQAPTVTPSSGRSLAKRSLMEARTGMLRSAHAIRCLPRSASAGSAMSKFMAEAPWVGEGSTEHRPVAALVCGDARSPGGEPPLEVHEDGDRAGIQPLLGGHV